MIINNAQDTNWYVYIPTSLPLCLTIKYLHLQNISEPHKSCISETSLSLGLYHIKSARESGEESKSKISDGATLEMVVMEPGCASLGQSFMLGP